MVRKKVSVCAPRSLTLIPLNRESSLNATTSSATVSFPFAVVVLSEVNNSGCKRKIQFLSKIKMKFRLCAGGENVKQIDIQDACETG